VGDFAGPVARAYRQFRPDLPEEVLDSLLADLDVRPRERALDLGAGTGQAAVGLAYRLAGVVALDPEPDMLAQLRDRAADDRLTNLVCVLGGADDLGAVERVTGEGAFALVTVVNALHLMDAAAVFRAARYLLADGGGVAVVSHGRPLWVGTADWAVALRTYLEGRFGPLAGPCGTDAAALAERRALLEGAGYRAVGVREHAYTTRTDVEHVVGNVRSALPAGRLTPSEQADFDDGLRAALAPYTDGPMIEDVPVTVLTGRR
jgi:SAM-dependent methyltransferase